VRIPPNAAHAAADLLLAYPVLACADPGACAGLLMPVAEAEAAMLEAASNRQDRMWAVQRPEILDRVWRAIRRSRHRRFDPAVRWVPRSASAVGLSVRHIPHLIDAEDYQELLAPLLPELTERTGRRQAARRHVPACSAPVACQQPVHLNGCTTSSTSGGCGRGARSSQTTWPGCPGRSSMATPGRPISSHRRRAGAV
jgi:hypothetical protein